VILQEKQLETIFSKYRLSSYSSFDEYKHNIAYSKGFYPCLAIIEVAFRNKINNFMMNANSDWLSNKDSLGSCYNLVEKTKKKLKKDNKVVSNASLVPELNFGFWVNLLSPHKTGFSFKTKHLKKIFGKDFSVSKSDLYHKLQKVLDFRNRVFHYEKVLGYSKFVDIEIVMNQILEIIDTDLLEIVRDIESL